jgi:cysteinyl-tRNA synthetase, unknown class
MLLMPVTPQIAISSSFTSATVQFFNRPRGVLQDLFRVSALAVALVGCLSLPARADSGPKSGALSAKALLAAATGWTYQLQQLDAAVAAQEAADVLVTDYSRDGSAAAALKPDDLDGLKRKPEGGRRLVLSYMSIGEAESYRFYWNEAWTRTGSAAARSATVAPVADAPVLTIMGDATGRSGTPDTKPIKAVEPPDWLHHENAEWRENYYVRFWDSAWQNLMFGSPESYLDRIMAAGFDGVYLDRADVYSFWETARPTSEADMIDFVARLSAYARAKNPEFLIVMQNAEELAQHRTVRHAIDGIAKESLLFGVAEAGAANTVDDIAASVAHLQRAKQAGLPVFVVEYLADPAQEGLAADQLTDLGFVATMASKALDTLSK